ncbi:tail protein [Vibrio phage 526E57-1]
MASSVHSSYDSLLQGISQQPVRDRQEGQAQDMLNMIPDPVNGLHDRPPTEYINSYFDTQGREVKWHHYTRSEDKYILGIMEDEVIVTDFTGTPQTVVTDSRALAYFARGTRPLKDRLHVVTLGDVTLVANREVETSILQPSAFEQWSNSLVYFRSINPGRTISVTVSSPGKPSVTVTYNVPTQVSTVPIPTDDIARNTDLQNQIKASGTDAVAAQIRDALNGNATFTANYGLNLQGSVLEVYSDHFQGDGTRLEVTCSVTDDMGGVSVYAINRAIPTVGQLPPYAPQGYVVRITNDGSSIKDDYFLKFNAPGGSGFTSQPGKWEEVAHPRQNFRLNPDDMPMAIIQLPDLSFKVHPLDPALPTETANIFWDDRGAGDDISNPFPDFLGYAIEDMGLFQERLYFLSAEAITFSESKNYWNFFKKSATLDVVTDPVNKPANNTEVSVLKYAVQHNRDLIVFADDSQFRIQGQQAITPKNTTMVVTTSFGTDLRTTPAVAGEVIFFPFKTGANSGIREFFTNNESDSNNARPITSHVKDFIKGSVIELLANSQEDILVVRAETNPNDLYVYHYLWQGTDRVQAAWHKWQVCQNCDIEYMFFDRSVLYVIQKEQSTNLVQGFTLNLEDTDVTGLTHNIYLDDRISATGVNTQVILPVGYPASDVSNLMAVQGEGCPYPGMRAVFTYDEPTRTLTFKFDLAGGTVYVGKTYNRLYSPSMPTLRDENGKAIDPYRFTMGNFTVRFDETGPFDVTVRHPQYSEFTVTNSNRIVGQAILGQVNLASSEFTTGIRMPVKDLEVIYSTDSYLPFNLASIEWKGQIKQRGRRI